MKILFTVIFSMAITTLLFAQTPDQALARVYYTFSHIRDTTQRDKPYLEHMLLVIGKNASLFTSYDKLVQGDKLANYIKEQTKANGGTLNNLMMQKGIMRPISPTDYYLFTKERRAFIVENMVNKYLIAEDIPVINWKITKDTTSFSGIHCQKAITYFKGRNWIAWYAPELPFQSGPWKLHGLPGLIIEAYDQRKDIQFQFAGMENVNESNTITKKEKIVIGTAEIQLGKEFYLGEEIKLPSNAIKATKEELDRLKQVKASNPEAAINSQLGGNGSVKRISAPANPSTTKKTTYNNPIELPDQL